VILNEEYEKIRQVREFLKTTARFLGFSERPIEDLFRASYFHYENNASGDEANEGEAAGVNAGAIVR